MSQYLIAYNNTQGFDQNEIHGVITGTPTISDWWHYLPNIYIVSTTSSAKYLADRIISRFQGLLFLVVRLDMRDYNGVLNRDAWEWIRKKNNQLLRVKPISSTMPQLPSSPLLDLFAKRPTPRPMTLEELLRIGKK